MKHIKKLDMHNHLMIKKTHYVIVFCTLFDMLLQLIIRWCRVRLTEGHQ